MQGLAVAGAVVLVAVLGAWLLAPLKAAGWSATLGVGCSHLVAIGVQGLGVAGAPWLLGRLKAAGWSGAGCSHLVATVVRGLGVAVGVVLVST